MNPISPKDFAFASEQLLNPEFLITTIDATHRAIHFGNDKLLMDIVPLRESQETPFHGRQFKAVIINGQYINLY